MDSLPASDFSSEKREIVECRINGLFYEQIIDHIFQRFKMKIYDDKISTCLYRSSLGYRWEFSMNGGNTPYLCRDDYETLKALINDFFELGSSMDCDSIIDEAEKLKTSRHTEAYKFLLKIKCQKLAQKIESQQISPPSRPWINGILSEIDAHIISRRLIDFKRLESCSVDVVDLFFFKFCTINKIIFTTLDFWMRRNYD